MKYYFSNFIYLQFKAWRSFKINRFNIIALSLIIEALQIPAQAQIVPSINDTGTVINQNDKLNNPNQTFDITGGTQAGTNLFHSFDKFGLDKNQTANFISNPSIQNILTRVQGGDASLINGLIQITGGKSNFYLMNPAGIIFGPGAQLNVPASFTATTANGIGFDSGKWFSATGVNNYASLTGTPAQFAFTMSQPGAIINNGFLSGNGTIALIGGTVISTGGISSWSGQVVVNAVAGEQVVQISEAGKILNLEVKPISTLPNLPNNWSIPISSLPQLLTGGNVTDASDVTVIDNKVVLTGSGVQIKNGDIVTSYISGQNVTLGAAGSQTKIEPKALFIPSSTSVVPSLPDIIPSPNSPISINPPVATSPITTPPVATSPITTPRPEPPLQYPSQDTIVRSVPDIIPPPTPPTTTPPISIISPITTPPATTTPSVLEQNPSLPITAKTNEPQISSPSLQSLQASLNLTPPKVPIVDMRGDNRIAANQLFDQANEFYRNNEFINARDNWQKALRAYRDIEDISGEEATLGALGGVHLHLHDYEKSLDYSQRLLSLAIKQGNLKSQAQASVNLGIANKLLGQYSKALDNYQLALSIVTQIGAKEIEVQALSNLGNTYEILGDYDNAITTYERSIKLARQMKMPTVEAITLGNLGAVYANLGDENKAIATYEQSLKISQSLKETSIQASTLINLGSIYHTRRPRNAYIEKASSYYQQALKIARTTDDKRREAEALANLGLVYEDLRNFPKAIKHQEQSVAIAKELKDPAIIGLTLNNLGNTLFRAGKLHQAEQKLRTAIQTFDSLRPGLNDSYKVSIFDTQAFTYDLLQQILIAGKKPLAALEASEQSRARAFKELLASRINENKVKTLSETNNTPVESSSINIDKIRQIARQQNATLVEYSIIRDDDFKSRGKQQGREQDLFIWVVKPTGEVSFRQVDLKTLWSKGATLTDTIQISRCLIADPFADCGKQMQAIRSLKPNVLSPKTSKSQDYRQILYQFLIEPITDLLPNNPEENVIFIPQGSLFLVPFPALQDKDGKYLIEKHTIRTAPSIQVLDLTNSLKNKRQQSEKYLSENPSKSSLIVGNPVMPQISLEPGQPLEQLPQLPEALQESLDIAKIMNTTAITGASATKANIVKLMPNARFIHLATHGLLEYGTLNGRVSLQGLGIPGAIALTPSTNDNGLLTANEIINLRLNAELVVLSACRTGEGRISGDGVIGLSRSFITAGVESVMVSLWNVRDVQTAKLMRNFYQALEKNPNKASALRQAMLITMKQETDPLYWAAFTLIGES